MFMGREMMDKLEFAEALGFSDHEPLMAASESIVRQGDIDWFVTRLPDGRWAAWDDAELALDRVAYFETREAAVRYHLDAYAEKYGEEMASMTIETLAGDLFATYRRNLAHSLECSEDELREITSRLADEDFEALATAQNAAEEAAWAEARRDPEWPRAGSEEEDAIAEAFQRLRYEAGF